MSFSSVAEYTLTGTFTSPNATEPFQIDRMLTMMNLRRVSEGTREQVGNTAECSR